LGNLAWLSGEIYELDDAKIGVQDRGFLFGDGVYDVTKIYNSRPFRLSAHLDRLQRSSLAISIDIPHSKEEIENITKNLIEKSKCSDGFIYMQVTRGCSPRDHFFPTGVTPTLLIYILDIGSPPAKKDVKTAKCITLPDERWMNCHIKSTNLLPNVLAIQKAKEAGAGEAILFRPDGLITEGTRTNIFAVIDNEVRTHPESNLILAGITRSIAIDIFRKSDTPCFEKAFNLEDLKKATEVWTTSTGLEISPVHSIDETRIGEVVPGPVCRYLIEEFWNIVETECYT
jgi:D-alanine transaminase